MKALVDLVTKVFALLKANDWLPILLARLALGIEFVSSGWSKLHHLDSLTGYFASLHIPAPGFNATLTATTEFVGGSLLLLGLATRFAAAPLTITMIVALLTAKLHESTCQLSEGVAQIMPPPSKLSDILYLVEPAFLIMFL